MSLINYYHNGLKFLKGKDPLLYYLLFIVGEPTYLLETEHRPLFCYLICGIIGQKISFKQARNIRHKLFLKLGTTQINITDVIDMSYNEWRDRTTSFSN